MTVVRSIERIITPQHVIEGAGVLLLRSFGPNRQNLFDPFLLFDHFAFNDPVEGPIRGFPTHPHRGIETVTYMLKGSVRHRDSIGNMGIIGPGDVQWMTSGRGILHEEMPQRDPEGVIQGFQLWVNLPAAEKMSQPRYQEIQSEEIPQVEEDGAGIRVVAGRVADARGPVTDIAAQPRYMDVALRSGATFRLVVPDGHTALAYLFEGEAWFGGNDTGPGKLVEAISMVEFSREGGEICIKAGIENPARFMLMTGAPFGEPIYPYGPFVMNTREEIEQALADLRNGTFVK